MIIDAFPNINYDGVPLVDIIRDYRSYVKRVASRYRLQNYTVVGDPTTEYLCYKLYGDPDLFWLLIYLNDIVDPWHGWVKSQEAVYETARQKYRRYGGVEQVLYYQTEDFEKFYDVVEFPKDSQVWYHIGDKDRLYPQYVGNLHPVYVYEDEEQQNDMKRVIKIISPSDIVSFINDLRSEIEKAKRGD